MSKVKIAHIRDSAGLYGAERVILTLSAHISRQEFDLTLIPLNGPEGKSETFIRKAEAAGIAVRPVSVRGRIDLRALLGIRKILREQSIRILHCHDFKSNFYGLVASMGLPVGRVVTAHGSTRDSFLKKVYLLFDEKVSYWFFDKIIAVSDRLRIGLEERGVPQRKIEVIPNAIDLSLIVGNQKGWGNPGCGCPVGERYVFGVIGRLFPDKGHRFFLHAFSRVLKDYPFITTMIVGEGPEKTEILHLVARLGLSGKVELCGEREDMEAVYRGVDAVIIPSLREGLPYVLLESMALRIPVVASAVGDIPVLVRDGETGWLIQPGDIGAIESRMRELITAPDKAYQMAARGYEAVNSYCSPRKMIEKMESVYRQVIADGK